MRLVVDTNIIISALLKDSVTRYLVLHPKMILIAPDLLPREIQVHHRVLLTKSDYDPDEYAYIRDTILSKVVIVPKSLFISHIPGAYSELGGIDITDTPFLALALMSGGDGIWSNDRHMKKQGRVRVWTTPELYALMR